MADTCTFLPSIADLYKIGSHTLKHINSRLVFKLPRFFITRDRKIEIGLLPTKMTRKRQKRINEHRVKILKRAPMFCDGFLGGNLFRL